MPPSLLITVVVAQISEESRIKFKRKNRRKCKGRKTRMPSGNDQKFTDVVSGSSKLYQWAETRFGAVTSYSTADGQAVQFYLGRDTSAGATCDVANLKPSQHTFTHQEVPVPIKGCQSQDNGKIFATRSFIIELLGRPEPSPGIEGLDVEIEAYDGPGHKTASDFATSSLSQSAVGGGPNSSPLLRELAFGDRGRQGTREVDFDLVIKTPEHLQWKLHSRRIPRKIGVVSNSPDVKTNGIKISEMGLREDDIPGSGQVLVEWANLYVSTTWLYVGVSNANTFRLRVPTNNLVFAEHVRGSNGNGKPIGPFGGNGRSNYGTGGKHDSSKSKGQGRGLNKEVTPRSGPWGDAEDSEHEAWGIADDRNGGGGHDGNHLTSTPVVSSKCENRTMEIKLLKSFIETHKLDKSKMFIGTPDCGMTSETKIAVVFKAPLTQCGINIGEPIGTKGVRHKASLVIQTPPGLGKQLLMEEMGSGYLASLGQAQKKPDTEIEGESDTDEIAERGSGLQDREPDGMYDDEDFPSVEESLLKEKKDRGPDSITFDVECIEPQKALQQTRKGIKPPKGTLATTPVLSQYEPYVSMMVSQFSFIERPVMQLPIRVSSQDSVHVHAKLKNKDATLLVDSCWFSRSDHPHNRSALPALFIKQGCDFGLDGVEWKDDPVDAPIGTNLVTSEFSIKGKTLHQLLSSNLVRPGSLPHWYLHCEYRDCQRIMREQVLWCPLMPEQRCKLYESQQKSASSSSSKWGPLTLGPFVIDADGSGYFKDGHRLFGQNQDKDTNNPEGQSGGQKATPQQLIIMEGLDPFLAVGIAFATFVLGIVLVAAIWCIHTRTGEQASSSASSSSSSSSSASSSLHSSPPLISACASSCCWCPTKTRSATHVNVGGSGDLTPNSSSPMTA
ncbi:transforming growth factor beta receptor type 3 [Plakobranchus ocellatus]|uniref:Transforming growth factor beta receptor type 3 n=1 Tax=Plakobranchus ocellatus TaxID=259542 RepID=A0AAV4DNE5_9GAST|nr:transforming growth factor beta receptor type 3 [Plakobranchus ocellatus]